MANTSAPLYSVEFTVDLNNPEHVKYVRFLKSFVDRVIIDDLGLFSKPFHLAMNMRTKAPANTNSDRIIEIELYINNSDPYVDALNESEQQSILTNMETFMNTTFPGVVGSWEPPTHRMGGTGGQRSSRRSRHRSSRRSRHRSSRRSRRPSSRRSRHRISRRSRHPSSKRSRPHRILV